MPRRHPESPTKSDDEGSSKYVIPAKAGIHGSPLKACGDDKIGILRLLFLFFLVSFSVIFPAFAQTAPAPVLPPSPPTQSDSSRVGVAAAVKGLVQVERFGQVGRNVESGEPIYLGDVIKTDANSHMQIVLLDETVFTVGPNSSMVIDEFVYDPSTDAGKINAKMVKGVFRFVTGKIAKKKPENMEVELPVGVVGIRGTIVALKVEGEKTLAVLYGPGANNNTGQKEGSFILKNTVNGKTQETLVSRTGRGATIENAASFPSASFRVPAQVIKEMNQGLTPAPQPAQRGPRGQSQKGAGGTVPPSGAAAQPIGGSSPGPAFFDVNPPTQLAGQDTAGAYGPLNQMLTMNQISQPFITQSDPSNQPPSNLTQVPDGITRLEHLLQIPMGVFHFLQTGVPTGGGKTYDIQFNINFGTRRVGGGIAANSSQITGMFPNGQTYEFHLFAKEFSSITPDGNFNYFNLPRQAGTCLGCSGDLRINFGNRNGIVAENSVYTLTVHRASSQDDSGTGNSPRLDGPIN